MKGTPTADLVLEGALVYDSAYRRFVRADVAVLGGRVLYVGPDCAEVLEAREHRDVSGRWLIPGLVDVHMHIESSMVTPPAFSRAVLRHGTTTCVAEPHEIANVFGVDGIRRFIELARGCEADIFFGVPSSVPSTGLETTGGVVTPDDVRALMADPQVACLGEVMDCRSLVEEPDGRQAAVVRSAMRGRDHAVIEGHVPAYTGLDLARILFAGVDSDHCEQTPERLRDRIAMGMFVEVQAKSVTPEVVEWLSARPELSGQWSFVTDDVMADQLPDGHLDRVVRRAISLGMPAELAIHAATTSSAERMVLRDRGRIAPGRLADIVVLDDLQGLHVEQVYKRGWLVGDTGFEPARHDFPESYYHSVHLEPLGVADFELRAPGGAGATVVARTMQVQTHSTFTAEAPVELAVGADGRVAWKEPGGLALARVFERHHNSGNVGTALLSGACLARGAVASTWVHDHHNLLVVGCDEADMALAANTLIAGQGGICAVLDGRVVAHLPLPVAGILTEDPLSEAADRLAGVTRALRDLGWGNVNPVMSLCTIGLPVSPALKVTDQGLVDVRAGRIVPLFG